MALPPEIIPPNRRVMLHQARPFTPPPQSPRLVPWRHLNPWRVVAVVLFLAIFVPLMVGVYTHGGFDGRYCSLLTNGDPLDLFPEAPTMCWVETALAVVGVGAITALLIAGPLTLFILLAVWTFFAVPYRAWLLKRRNRVRDAGALVEVPPHLRHLPKDQLSDYRRHIPPRTTRR